MSSLITFGIRHRSDNERAYDLHNPVGQLYEILATFRFNMVELAIFGRHNAYIGQSTASRV